MAQSVIGKVGALPAPAQTGEWIECMAACGIRRMVFTGRDSDHTSSFDVSNEYVAEVASRYADNVIGFAGIHPLRGMASVRAVDRAVRELGLKGIAVDPFGLETRANDARLFPVYARCAEWDVPVVITCGPLPFRGPRLEFGDVRWIDDIAEYFPELTIIISHGGWPWVTETVALAFRHEHVYVDTSFYAHLPGGEMLAHAANSIIPDKVLFASGFPIVPVDTALERIRNMPFRPDTLQCVLYTNAETLLRRHRCL